MKSLNPLITMFLIVILIGSATIALIHFIIVPFSSEYSKLQLKYEEQTNDLQSMTKQYQLAKVLVQNKQDELSLLSLKAYIEDTVDNLSLNAIELVSKAITGYHREFGIPISILVGMIEVESMFNTTAYNKSGARGLMQVILRYHEETLNGVVKIGKELHDPSIGIRAGITVLNNYLSIEENNLEKALHRYNGLNGEKGVYSSKVYAVACKYEMFRTKYFFRNDHTLNTANIMKELQENNTEVKTSSEEEMFKEDEIE